MTRSPISASPAERLGPVPGMPLKYSELTPSMIGALKLLRALEVTYPQCGDRASRTLEGFAAWSRKRHLRSNVTDPGMTTNG